MCSGKRCKKREDVVSSLEEQLLNLEREVVHSEGPCAHPVKKFRLLVCAVEIHSQERLIF